MVMLSKISKLARIVVMPVVITGIMHSSLEANASKYGVSQYGRCNYQDACEISITTSGTVSLPVTPTASSVYTIQKDSVTITTNSDDGYTLTLESDSSAADGDEFKGPSSNILASTSGTISSPSALGVNEWGYRIDSIAGFGSGPTSAVSNVSSSSLTFAGISLYGSPTTIKTTSSSAPTGDTTEVWYGVRVDISKPSGIYSRSVIYTAVAL